MASPGDKASDLKKEIFIPLQKEGEIERLFHHVAEKGSELSAQLQDGSSVQLKADSFHSGFLFCVTTAKLEDEQKLSFQFKHDGELYFAQFSVLPLNAGLCRLKPPGKVFRLQRRQSYRVRIPKEQGARFAMVKPFRAKLPLVDISAGGFQVMAPSTTEVKNMTEGQMVSGLIELGPGYEALQVELCLRRKQAAGEEGQIALGFEVVDPEQLVEMRLLSYVMEIYRVFYSHPMQRNHPSDKKD